MPFSCHSHSGEFCKHAFGNLEEIVERAIGLGFTHYGLSEHMPRCRLQDLYDEELEAKLTPDDLTMMFDNYVAEGRRLQQQYKDQINLTVGMETECINGDIICKAKELKSKYPLDYLVGSVHHVDGIPTDFSFEKYLVVENTCGGTEKIMGKYYDQQYEMMMELKPEVIGHFDLICLYRPEFQLTEPLWKKIKRNIDFGITYGALFEINTAGASERKKLGRPYPHPDILKLLVSCGAKLTLSDDCHGPGDVGWWYSSLPMYLETYGINCLYYLESCADSSDQVIPGKVVCKKLENCLDHPFWKSIKLTN